MANEQEYMNPSYAQSMYRKASAVYKTGDYQEAEPLLNQCLVSDKDDYVQKGACARYLGILYISGKLGQANYTKAAEFFSIYYNEETTNRSFFDIDGVFWQGFSRYKAGYYEQAFSSLQASVEKNPLPHQKAMAAAALGDIYFYGRLGQIDYVKAAEYFDLASELEQENYSYMLNGFLSHLRIGDTEQLLSFLSNKEASKVLDLSRFSKENYSGTYQRYPHQFMADVMLAISLNSLHSGNFERSIEFAKHANAILVNQGENMLVNLFESVHVTRESDCLTFMEFTRECSKANYFTNEHSELCGKYTAFLHEIIE